MPTGQRITRTCAWACGMRHVAGACGIWMWMWHVTCDMDMGMWHGHMHPSHRKDTLVLVGVVASHGGVLC
jgi:hypothetical protein